MSTRTKTMSLVSAIAAIAVAIPTAVQAYAEPTPSPAPAPADTGGPAGPVPTATKVPDPQGSGCGAYRAKVPTGPGSIESMALETGSQAIANNPDLSTFSGFLSGKLNPDINIVSVLDGGPYVVFAPTNDAFAKLDPATLETLKSDPRVLLPVLFYHMVLGYLTPNDVQGKMPTQDGRPVVVTGKGGDVKVNDNKIVCAYTAHGAYIYMIDTVLTPPDATSATATSSATTSATTSAATSASETATTSAAPTSATETPSTAASTQASTPASETPATSAAPSATETPATPSAASATPSATESAPATPVTTTPKAAA